MTTANRTAMIATSILLHACAQQGPDSVPANQSRTEAAAAPAPTPTPEPALAEPTTEQPTTLPPLTAEGWGPLNIGMTRARITAALGPDANPQAVGGPDPEHCDQYRPERAPRGMLLMVENGRLTRISLTRDAQVKTGRGLALGATPAQVRAAYGPELQASPHKYADPPSEYLTFWTKAGAPPDQIPPPASRGIRYEVNGEGVVGAIHAGAASITYVEGCA